MARNSLQMLNGYSSHQLVFGENPNMPNIINDNLPALEGTTSSEVFAKHLNALHAARKIFIQTVADARVRRALRNKVRASEQIFENGNRVFYKREGKERWLGPGKVVFLDGKVVFVRHGGIFVRVSPNRLQKVNSYLTEVEDEKAVDQGMKDNEKEENTDSKQSISEEIPAMTAEPNEDNTQIIQNIPAATAGHTDDNVQAIQNSRPKLKVNDIIQ